MSEKILLSQTVCYQTINQDVNLVNQLNINIQKFFDKIQGLIQKNHTQTLKKNIRQTVLNLTEQYLYWESSGKKFTILLEDIVGVFEEEIFFDLPNYLDNQFLLIINSYPIKVNKLTANKKRKFQQHKFFFSDQAVRDNWLETIKNILHIPAKRNLQIIVNPYSGKGEADKILRKILPIFHHSNLSFFISKNNNLIETEKFIKNLDLSEIDGLVIIGGDGTIHQIINILINRYDWQKYHHIPLGIIPGGTSNGLSKSILELAGQDYDLINATLLIIRGKYQPLDIVKIQQYCNDNRKHKNHNHQISYSFLSISWGLISDVDIESDHLRFLGTLKTDIYALFKVLTLNSYQGKIFLLNPINKKSLKSDDLLNITTNYSQLYNLSSENWQKMITEDFILLWVINPRWAAYNLKTAPDAEISDGKIDVLIVKKGVTKWQILQAFLLCATGQHISLDYVEYYQAEGLFLEPLATSGNLAIDGEKYDYLPIKLTMVQNLINIFS